MEIVGIGKSKRKFPFKLLESLSAERQACVGIALVVRVRRVGGSIMVRYQGQQRHRHPLGARGTETERAHRPLRKAGIEVDRAELLAVFADAVMAGMPLNG